MYNDNGSIISTITRSFKSRQITYRSLFSNVFRFKNDYYIAAVIVGDRSRCLGVYQSQSVGGILSKSYTEFLCLLRLYNLNCSQFSNAVDQTRTIWNLNLIFFIVAKTITFMPNEWSV